MEQEMLASFYHHNLEYVQYVYLAYGFTFLILLVMGFAVLLKKKSVTKSMQSLKRITDEKGVQCKKQ